MQVNTAGSSTTYDSILRMLHDSAGDYGLAIQFGDSGYGNRLMFPMNSLRTAAVVNYYRTTHVKSEAVFLSPHHFALCRENGTVRAYLNGVNVFDKISYNNTVFAIAPISLAIGGSSGAFTFTFQDFHVYNKSRYSSDFTPT